MSFLDWIATNKKTDSRFFTYVAEPRPETVEVKPKSVKNLPNGKIEVIYESKINKL